MEEYTFLTSLSGNRYFGGGGEPGKRKVGVEKEEARGEGKEEWEGKEGKSSEYSGTPL